jgi:hypothetical protein
VATDLARPNRRGSRWCDSIPLSHNLSLGGQYDRSIEDVSHYRRDVILGEDASRIRKGSAPQLMAALRNLILFVLNRSGRTKLTDAIRHFMCHPQKAIDLLSTPI